MQRPDATLVAGYQAWQKKFNRHVMRGEKGIQIISPAPIKEKEEVEKIDPITNEPILKEDGQPETEIIEHVIPRFKVSTVFDVSQTDGEPLPDLGGADLTENVADFDVFMEAIRNVSPVPIRMAEIEGDSHGYYHNVEKEIVIQIGMSESQTMKTAIHEVTHAMLHDRDMLQEQGIEKDRLTKEVEAESVAYTVCQHFGLDSSEYSFPYIAGWSSGKEMKELRASMDVIRRTAGDFIEDMTEQLRSLKKELNQEKTHLEKDDLILKISGAMGSEYSYQVVANLTAEQLLEVLEEYQRIPEQNKTDIETFLSEKGTVLIPWYDSIGYKAEYPLDFYDLEYDYDTGITVVSELSAMKQAEILIKREEYESTLFNAEERNLIVNYAFKLNNMEGTKMLISEIHEAMESPDVRAVNDVIRVAQAEIDALPDSMVGISEMYDFGYSSNLMLPLTKDRALELFRDGCEIFHLYSDDTEAVVDDETDFDTVDDFYGIEKATWEKYRLQENDRGMDSLQDAEKYQRVDFFDVPALFANGRVDISTLPEGIYRYELQGADYDPGYPLYVKESVVVNHAGTILTAYPMEIPEQRTLRLGVGLDFTGDMQNIQEYQYEIQERDKEADLEIMESAVIRENEDILLSGDKERYGIYQILDGTKGREYLFMGMDFVNSQGIEVDGGDYAFIYGGKLTETDTLDSLYEKFNLHHPEGYYGHSLSVSDVVVLQKDKHTKAYYVDSFGFRELPDFVRQRMHEAEMNRKREDSVITLDTTGVEIEQHEGLWHTVDKMEIENEIFYLMRHNELGDSVAAVILNSDGELVAQELEHGFDQGAMEAIREFLADKGIEWNPEISETEETGYPALYSYDLTYAMEHGEADAYLDSRKLNIDCKNAIEQTIRDNYDGWTLKQDTAKSVLETYGAERVSFILACTLEYKSSDGRFSTDNKNWGKTITIPQNINRGVDANLDYVVESHPAVLNGFINMTRIQLQELEKETVDLDKRELEKLAEDIDQFSEDYDTYGYRDAVEDRENNIYMIYSDLLAGETKYLREWLADIADDKENNMDDVIHDAEKLLKRIDKIPQKENEIDASVMKDTKEKKATISFYVAECMEFPVMGEYHDNLSLQEALKIYENIPADRMHGIKGIGFMLHDGSIYDDMEYELMSADKIREDMLDLVPYYKENPLVQKAIADIRMYFDSKQEKEAEVSVGMETNDQQKSEKSNTVKDEHIPEKNTDAESKSALEEPGNKKESVLKALRERQAKLKSQAQEKNAEKSQVKKKGEQEL